MNTPTYRWHEPPCCPTRQQKAAETRRAMRLAKRKALLQGLKKRVAESEGRHFLYRWNETLREAAAQHPDFLLLGDLLPIVNADRLNRGLRPATTTTLLNLLKYNKCISKIILTIKNGRHIRVWHRAHAIDITTSSIPHCPHEKTENIWAALPEKYRDDPNWMTIREVAKKLGCPIARINGLCKEYGTKRVFLHPETKRRLCYLPEFKDTVNWRSRRFILSHCTPAQANHIFATARKKIKYHPHGRSYIYYCPELKHL